MNHIPRFFVNSKRVKDKDPKKNPRTPRLERRNAAKHIEYEASSSSSSFDYSSNPLYTRSLDLYDRTSFRIGNEGELDRVWRSLGLSGPEDLAIPVVDWEAMKMRSSSDLLPRSKLHGLDSLETGEPKEAEEIEVIGDLADRFEAISVIRGETDSVAETSGSSGSIGGVWGSVAREGIKGVRPPVLKPPPSMRLPVVNDACSTWEILRELAPQDHQVIEREVENGVEVNEAEREVDGVIEKMENEDYVAGFAEIAALSDHSCSFTTSIDDDSSSIASNFSPTGKFRRNITGWGKGVLLGRGSFGSVYEGISHDGFFFAVKEVSLLDQGSQGKQSVYQLEQEIALLSQFEHENIVQYYGTQKDESNLYIFLELVTKGSLADLYQTYHLRDSQVSVYTRQILHGLKYLHDRNVIHRDIKCANILVDASGLVKLADFGLAKATKFNDVKSCKGTTFWMAPEVVRGKNQGYGIQADIWSLGCTVLEMLTGQIPYSHLECMQALYRIGKGEAPPVPDSLSKDAQDFIQSCLQVNPDDRPTAAQLLDHPFLKKPLPVTSGCASPYNPSRRGCSLNDYNHDT